MNILFQRQYKSKQKEANDLKQYYITITWKFVYLDKSLTTNIESCHVNIDRNA